jgi:hypothetical protein
VAGAHVRGRVCAKRLDLGPLDDEVRPVTRTSQSNSGGGAHLPEPGTEDVLYMVDISGYVFRAFYALPPLTSERGEPTGALYVDPDPEIAGKPVLS